MRIAATSDVHIDRNGPDTLAALVARVAALAPDVLIVAGDIATPVDTLTGALAALRPCAREVVWVSGNHDVWVSAAAQAAGWTADRRLHDVLPAVAQAVGAPLLDVAPVVVDGVAFVGTMGWYDFSFRDRELDAPEAAYRGGSWEGVRWMDTQLAPFFVDGVRQEPEAVAGRFVELLRARLAAVDVDRIVAVTHFLPFRVQAWRSPNPIWRFVNAFMGCEALGRTLLADPRVEVVVSGHTHVPSDRVVDGVRAVVSPLGYRREWRESTVDEAAGRAVTLIEL